MADEKYVSKVVVNNQVKIDLTGDTIAPEDVINGKTFHDRSGAPKVGTSTYDADTSDATATSAEKDENYLSQVTINPIPVSEVENEQGGITLTIG